jgi:Domain of unknown function (DUF4136)
MRRLLALYTTTLAAALLAGCAATMTAGSHAARDHDFSGYRTYAWGAADALPAGDARLQDNAEFVDRVTGAIERQLAARGFSLAASGSPDLLVHYHATVAPRVDPGRLERAHGSCYQGDCRLGPVEYEAGTLVVDVIDARTNRLIWRGWSRNSVERELDDPDRMTELVEKAVARILQRLPRTL